MAFEEEPETNQMSDNVQYISSVGNVQPEHFILKYENNFLVSLTSESTASEKKHQPTKYSHFL